MAKLYDLSNHHNTVLYVAYATYMAFIPSLYVRNIKNNASHR